MLFNIYQVLTHSQNFSSIVTKLEALGSNGHVFANLVICACLTAWYLSIQSYDENTL